MLFTKKVLSFFTILITLTVNSAELVSYKNELITLGELDQRSRAGDIDWDSTISLDKANLVKLKALINNYGFPTLSKVGKDAHIAAFLIVQHAVHDKEYMVYYRDEMQKRLGSNDIVDKLYAYLLDRTNRMDGIKQVYGTQGDCVNGEWVVKPVENPNKLSTLRKEIGLLPLARFAKEACTPPANG